MRRIVSALPAILRDLAGLTGAALVSYGVWLAWHPGGFIAAGVLLLAGAWLTARGG